METPDGVKVTWRGWPGHFICAPWCVFHLNTLIEFMGKKVVVSTVGMMMKPPYNDPSVFDKFGGNRYFETMAFESKYDEWDDIDVERQIEFDSPWSIPKLKDGEKKAQENHLRVVDEIIEKLLTNRLALVGPNKKHHAYTGAFIRKARRVYFRPNR